MKLGSGSGKGALHCETGYIPMDEWGSLIQFLGVSDSLLSGMIFADSQVARLTLHMVLAI